MKNYTQLWFEMLVVLSPTKRQRHQPYSKTDTPLFFSYAQDIRRTYEVMDPQKISQHFNISPKLAEQTHNMFKDSATTPALFLYQGEAFKSLAPQTLEHHELSYAQKHLCILSAMYGLLRPFDAIQTYRLDFSIAAQKLYDFWSQPVTQTLNQYNQEIINCASQEYSRLINKQQLTVPIIDIHFLVQKGQSSPKVVSIHAKQARGTFARYVIQNKPQSRCELKLFNEDGYIYAYETKNSITFIKTLP